MRWTRSSTQSRAIWIHWLASKRRLTPFAKTAILFSTVHRRCVSSSGSSSKSSESTWSRCAAKQRSSRELGRPASSGAHTKAPCLRVLVRASRYDCASGGGGASKLLAASSAAVSGKTRSSSSWTSIPSPRTSSHSGCRARAELADAEHVDAHDPQSAPVIASAIAPIFRSGARCGTSSARFAHSRNVNATHSLSACPPDKRPMRDRTGLSARQIDGVLEGPRIQSVSAQGTTVCVRGVSSLRVRGTSARASAAGAAGGS